MKSPITGKEMKLTKERRSMEFRKETFEIVFHYFLCEDSGEQFSTTSLDEVNMGSVPNIIQSIVDNLDNTNEIN